MSNMSSIPNQEYNIKRWRVIETIHDYLDRNPKDAWANRQVKSLLAIPNITRGGDMGNDNLLHWANLYKPDLFDGIREQKNKEQK